MEIETGLRLFNGRLFSLSLDEVGVSEFYCALSASIRAYYSLTNYYLASSMRYLSASANRFLS